MDDKTLQRKLNQLVEIANELQEEAQQRYGKEALLLYEADGTFYIMTHDTDGTSSERQQGIRASSTGYCLMGSGAW